MKSLLYYFIQVITTSGILYGYYHFFLRNKKFHVYNRFYLLIAASITILIPFVNIPIYFTAGEANSSFVLKTIASISANDFGEPPATAPRSIKNSFPSTQVLVYSCYILISIILVARILFSLQKIRRIKKKYKAQQIGAIHFINTDEPGTPFSFFRWLFWNQKIDVRSPKGEQVFRHELFHIEQRHSLDILYIELLATIFWINPFLHLIRREIKVIHEFLADQFAASQSENWEYAELLLMQSLNTEHRLTNPFFYNQIKRRIAMITSSQKTSHQYLRKLMVLPVAAIIIALFAFSYKSKKERISPIRTDRQLTVVIDAGHGIDAAGNHTGVAVPGNSYEDDIVLSIAKKIKELNTNDRLQIILTRETKNIVDLKKRVEFSTEQNADLLISLHTNAESKQEKNTKGIDILFSGKNEKYYAESKILATILYNYFYQIRPVNDIQTPKNNVYVIDNSNCPSVLIECGYLTDPKDLAFVKGETGQAEIAKSILQSIDQYFSQKNTADWEEKKRIVSDTTLPLIEFNKNLATGKMEGTYNGKKFTKMTDHEGQFILLFDDNTSTMIAISKEQTEVLKHKYGKNLNVLMIQDPRKQKAEERELRELKELSEQTQTESGKAQMEIEHLMEEKQLTAGKQESELKELLGMKELETEKNQQEFRQLMNLKQLTSEGDQMDLKRKLDTLQNNDGIKAMEKIKQLMDDQEQLEATQKEFLLKQQGEERRLEKSKNEYLLRQQKENAQLEKSKNEYLLKQQKENAQLEKQQGENKQKANIKDSTSRQN